jgi:hypothetical protein
LIEELMFVQIEELRYKLEVRVNMRRLNVDLLAGLGPGGCALEPGTTPRGSLCRIGLGELVLVPT